MRYPSLVFDHCNEDDDRFDGRDESAAYFPLSTTRKQVNL